MQKEVDLTKYQKLPEAVNMVIDELTMIRKNDIINKISKLCIGNKAVSLEKIPIENENEVIFNNYDFVSKIDSGFYEFNFEDTEFIKKSFRYRPENLNMDFGLFFNVSVNYVPECFYDESIIAGGIHTKYDQDSFFSQTHSKFFQKFSNSKDVDVFINVSKYASLSVHDTKRRKMRILKDIGNEYKEWLQRKINVPIIEAHALYKNCLSYKFMHENKIINVILSFKTSIETLNDFDMVYSKIFYKLTCNSIFMSVELINHPVAKYFKSDSIFPTRLNKTFFLISELKLYVKNPKKLNVSKQKEILLEIRKLKYLSKGYYDANDIRFVRRNNLYYKILVKFAILKERKKEKERFIKVLFQTNEDKNLNETLLIKYFKKLSRFFPF